MGHHVNRVRLHDCTLIVATFGRNSTHHRVGDFVVTLGPGIDNFVVLFTLSDQAVHVLLFKVLNLIACLVNQGPFGLGDQHVVLTKGNPGAESFAETHGHDLVTEDNGFFLTTVAVDRIDDLLHFFLTQQAVHQIERRFGVQRQQRTKANTAWCGVETLHYFVAFGIDLFDPRFDLGVQVHGTGIKRVFDFLNGTKHHALARHAFAFQGRIVQTQDHILRWNDDRCAVCRRQNVVRGHHQNTRFKLCFKRQWYVNSHLVAVKVSVKGRTDQRMQLDRFTLDQNRFERLNAQTVQRRRTV